MSKKHIPTNGIVYSTDPEFRPEAEETAQEALLPPAKQPLRILLDTKQRGGKVVTLVEHFVGPADALEQLGKTLKTFCGTGGSVKDRMIIIQGDQREKLRQWFGKNGYSKVKG